MWVIVKRFFVCYRKISGACTEGSLRPDRYPERSEKKSYFNVENNRLWNKMSFFSFFVSWNRNLTSESDKPHHFVYKTHVFFVWIRRIWKNKNITSSGQYHYFWFTSGFSSTSGYRSCLKLPSVHAPDIFLSHAKNRLVLSQICGPLSGPPFLAF